MGKHAYDSRLLLLFYVSILGAIAVLGAMGIITMRKEETKMGGILSLVFAVIIGLFHLLEWWKIRSYYKVADIPYLETYYGERFKPEGNKKDYEKDPEYKKYSKFKKDLKSEKTYQEKFISLKGTLLYIFFCGTVIYEAATVVVFVFSHKAPEGDKIPLIEGYIICGLTIAYACSRCGFTTNFKSDYEKLTKKPIQN